MNYDTVKYIIHITNYKQNLNFIYLAEELE